MFPPNDRYLFPLSARMQPKKKVYMETKHKRLFVYASTSNSDTAIKKELAKLYTVYTHAHSVYMW